MRLSQDGIPQPGRWNWCPPDARPLPFDHAFSSGNWDADKSFAPGLGEVGHPAGANWYNGGPGLPCADDTIVGPPAWWRTGIPASQFNEFCYPGSGGIQFCGSAPATLVTSVPFPFCGGVLSVSLQLNLNTTAVLCRCLQQVYRFNWSASQNRWNCVTAAPAGCGTADTLSWWIDLGGPGGLPRLFDVQGLIVTPGPSVLCGPPATWLTGRGGAVYCTSGPAPLRQWAGTVSNWP